MSRLAEASVTGNLPGAEERPGAELSPEAVRALIRAGRYSGATAGLAPG